MKLIEYNTVGIEAMLVSDIGGQHLVYAAGWKINKPFLRIKDFHTLGQGRAHPHHIRGYIKNNGCLVAVCGTAVNFGPFFVVTTGEKQGNSSRKLAFSHLLRYLHKGRVKLAITIWLQRSEDIADDLLLPVDEFKWFSRPCSFGVGKAFNEADRIIRSLFTVARVFGYKRSRFILFQFSNMRSPPYWHKNRLANSKPSKPT
jgi:hypothetical protein